MKLIFRTLARVTVLTLLASGARGQSPSAVATSSIADSAHASVSERGPHHRVWSRVTLSTNRFGKVIAQTNSFTELETGMHVRRNGEWVESNPEIKITTDGAEAVGTLHQVRFAANLNSSNAVTVLTPDGLWLSSRILGLAYFDESSGQAVLIAPLQDSIGELVGPGHAVYFNAFADLEADVEYVNTKSGFEQNIVLRAQPPLATLWKLNPATTRLQVWTEFFGAPTPEKTTVSSARGVLDEKLRFGSMIIGRGKAFLVGGVSEPPEPIIVGKRWLSLENGRTFLVEEVRLDSADEHFQALPESKRTAQVEPTRMGRGATLLAAMEPVVSKVKVPPAKSGNWRMAKLDRREPGLVIDYTIVSGASDFVFKADTTYLCTNTVNLTGTTVCEGGSVLKISTNALATINLNETVDCRTEAYRPMVVTSKDDDTVGQVIPGSTGSPQKPNSGSWLVIAASGNTLKHFRFSHAASALKLYFDEGTCDLAHMQFVDCRYAVEFGGDVNTVQADNCLFYGTTNVFRSGVDNILHCRHLTVNQCQKFSLHSGSSNGELYLTNSLLVAISGGLGPFAATVTDHCATLSSDSGIFQNVGAGAHYLAEGSTNQNAGTTNISAGLLADLRKRTTYPPLVYSNVTLSADLELYPQVQRDTDLPDLGYHYDPLDYAFGFVRVTNCTIQVEPGTVIGAFSGGSTFSIGLLGGSTFDSRGTAMAPNWISRYNTVQEQANLNWTNSTASDWSIAGNWLSGGAAELICRFTKFSALANRSTHYGDVNQATVNWFADCEFSGGNFFIAASSLHATNCLFDRVYTTLSDEYALNDLSVRNCLFNGGLLDVIHLDAGDFVLRDNLFDQPTVYQDGNIDGDWNGYTTGTTRLAPNGMHDIPPTNHTFKAGPLGRFYLASGSSFIDVGSTTADLVGLYHFTTTTNLVTGLQVKEEGGTVDIGYHYVAVNANGDPSDSDSDGIPDYCEDQNGNGAVNSGEIDWEDPYDLGLKVLITRPRSNSVIP